MNKLFTQTVSVLRHRKNLVYALPKHPQEDEKRSLLTSTSLSFCFKILTLSILFLATGAGELFAQQPINQNVTIKGKILDDEDGLPLIGTTISDNARRVLGVTNQNGEFSVSIIKGGTISFNMVGYTPISRIFSANQTGVTIRLKSSSSQLNEVVVTALGIKREEKALGYAVTKIDSTQLTDAVSTNWTDALSGKVAGLNLVRSNSGPAGSIKIILRGENNLTGDNEALIVVDGVVINNSGGRRTANGSDAVYGTGSDNMPADYGSTTNDINPEDIESVTVLKGPGAAALYGQRGANGAILITTKSGNSKRKKVGIKFTSNGSFEEVNRWPDLQYEYGQGLDGAAYYSYGASADGASTSGTSSAYGPRFDGQMFFQYDPVTQTQGKTRTPWVPYTNEIRDFFSTGENLTNSLSIDGKIRTTTARVSITNQNNTWIVPKTGIERTTVTLSTNTDITKKLKFSTKFNYGNRFSDNLPGAGYGNQSLMYWYIFWQPNASLDWIKNYWVNGQEGRQIKYPFSSFPENPYAVVNEFINKTGRNNLTANAQLSYQITKNLSVQLRTSIDMAKEKRAQERPYDAGSKLIQGSIRKQNIYSQETNSDFLVRYEKQVGKDLNFNLSAGGSQLRNKYNKSDLRADGLRVPNVYELTNNLYPLVSIPDTSRYRINSFYGILSTSYKNYLYVDVTARKDWSSVLATVTRTDNVGFFYPSISGSFVLSEFWKLPKAISFAKIRASVSQVGSGGTTPYRTAYTYSLASNGIYPDSALQNPSILPNENLKPLKTTTYEVGTEVSLFKNRLGFDVAVYAGNTKNQILTRVVDRSSGYNQALINAGQVNNLGVEVAVNGTPITVKNGFKWTVNLTFASNQNKIKALTDSSIILRTGPVAGGQIVAKVGGSMGDLYGRGYVRDPDGNVVYDATTGFAKITTDVVYLGNTMPKYKGSIGNNFSYKNFSLNVLFDAQLGGVAHSLLNYKLAEQGKLAVTLPGRYGGIIGNGVVQKADGTYVPNTTVAYDIDEYYRSHMGTDNAEGSTFRTDFIKFREASFNYRFNPKFLKKLGLSTASFGVYGRNLFIWSPWPMFDPEFGTLAGSDIVTGFEVGQFPSTRTYGFNLSIGI
ncbi:SusC/RagA family TonB-linked outer membrane protein [Pedobacter yonginense]|uniref:SusC/RagA family TonB-linked outer membrane protein n=1 Tax=Pedobacter yonginense TaxID=651869 RepID=A0A317ERG9_9SPHI|nr:SusC/RagA family TonB-linked outer membrane protein [Pedobacter yonginense]PWS29052.1 SusC/RagA family TonB-linked outer membrane protein [Pedobacter yonginense]